MGQITIRQTIDAPVASVFEYVDDYRNTTKYMKDLVKWKPTTEVTHGKGSKFEVGMKAGPTTLSSVVDINAWTQDRVIGWKSLQGFKQAGKWSFKSNGGQTDVTFEMEYEFGGGIAGRMLSRAAEPFVRSNLEASVRNLKAQTEKLASAPAKKASTAAKKTSTTAKTSTAAKRTSTAAKRTSTATKRTGAAAGGATTPTNGTSSSAESAPAAEEQTPD